MTDETLPFAPKKKRKKKTLPTEETTPVEVQLIPLQEPKRNERGQFISLQPGDVTLARGSQGPNQIWSTKGGFSAERYALTRLCRADHLLYYNELKDIAMDKNTHPSVRHSALKTLLEFGFGKAAQALTITDDREKNADGDLKTYTRAELADVMEKQQADRANLMNILAGMQARMEAEGKKEEEQILQLDSVDEKVVNAEPDKV